MMTKLASSNFSKAKVQRIKGTMIPSFLLYCLPIMKELSFVEKRGGAVETEF